MNNSLLNADSVCYERQVFLLRRHLVRTVFVLNEVLIIGRSFAEYEAAYDICQRTRKNKKPEILEMAKRYETLIVMLREAETYLQTGK